MLGLFFICLLWKFKVYKSKFFGGMHTQTTILIAKPKTGDYAEYDSNARLIRIDREVITGEDGKTINPEAPIKGRMRFIFDALLHEMIHMYCVEALEVEKEIELYHGLTFQDECNRIAGILGLEIYEGYDEYEWFPLNIRPESFYMGASLEFSDKENKLVRQKPPPGSMIARLIKGTEKGDDDKI
jgi:hypothetical protein